VSVNRECHSCAAHETGRVSTLAGLTLGVGPARGPGSSPNRPELAGIPGALVRAIGPVRAPHRRTCHTRKPRGFPGFRRVIWHASHASTLATWHASHASHGAESPRACRNPGGRARPRQAAWFQGGSRVPESRNPCFPGGSRGFQGGSRVVPGKKALIPGFQAYPLSKTTPPPSLVGGLTIRGGVYFETDPEPWNLWN
jgi:hypothetical protein